MEAVARVATSRRDRLLRIHRRRLRWEDLEDCYSQATLELVARARRDPFASPEHILNALEQKFTSRIDDRRRAIGGRSPIEMALARALPVHAPESGVGDLEDPSAEVVRQVGQRLQVRQLHEVASELTPDQRLVLACQISLDMDCGEFCRRFGWSAEKFRKVAQRARARLRALVGEYEVGARCARLEPDLLAYAARAGTDEQTQRATEHLANCTACASHLRALDRASRQVAAVLPAPFLAKAGLLAKVGAVAVAARRVLGATLGRGPTEVGAASVAGGSAVGAGAVKLGVAAACLAGAAGGYALCAPGLVGSGPKHHHGRVQHVARASSPLPASRSAAVTAAAARRTAARVPTQPVHGAAAAAVAHREFGGGTAHIASTLPPTGVTISATSPSSSRPASSPESSSGAASSPESSNATSGSSQARREFGGFER